MIPVRAGRCVTQQGEASTGVWIVESGLLRATTVGLDGRELTLDVLGPGDAVGEPRGIVSGAAVRAERPSRLRPASTDAACSALARRAARLEMLAADLAWLDVACRIERRLRDLAERFGRPVPGGTAIPLSLTQQDLASLAGTSRESANRALGRLVRAGRVWSERRGRYVVGSPDPSCSRIRLHEPQ